MNNSMSCSDGRWCTRADALLGVEGIHVRSVTATGRGLVLSVETGEDVTDCPDCGVVAVGHGRRRVRLHDIPCFGKPVMLLWAKRVWRCPDRDCPRTTFTEDHALAGPRAKLTARAVAWATDALQRFDTSDSALAHQLGVSWHTVWTPGCWTWFREGLERPTQTGSKTAAPGSPPGSRQRLWIRSGAP